MSDLHEDIFAEPEPDLQINGEPDRDDTNLFGPTEERPQYVDEERRSESKPRPVGRVGRTPLNKLIEYVWGGAGAILQQTGIDIPVGRTLVFQAPVAGAKLEELMRGTVVDRLLQPFAEKMETSTDVGAVVLLPVLVGAYWRKPEFAPALAPVLRSMVDANLDAMLPILKKEQRKRKRTAEQVKEMTDLFELPEGSDPIDAILGSIFAVPTGYEQPQDVPQTEPIP